MGIKMKQILLLTKVQLGSVFTFIKGSKNRTKKRNTFVLAALFSLFAIFLAFVSFMYSYVLGMSLKTFHSMDLLPEIMMAVTCIVTLITTIYKVKGTLFGFKDYDLIMSLPVKTSRIVASRLVLLYIVNIAFTLIIMLPAGIAYGLLKEASYKFYIITLLTVWFIPLFPMILATLIGTVVTLIASRFRHTNIANIILTFSLLTAYMIFSARSSTSPQALGEMSAVLSNKTDRIYPLARMYKSAVCEFNIGSLLFFVSISIVSFILFSWIVGLEFKKINTLATSARVKANYKIKTLKVEKPLIAMYKKELSRYFSSSLYVMNTAFGIVMMTIAAVALLFMRPESFAAILVVPELADKFVFFAAAILAFCIAMSSTTACSISLEGKNLWIIKSLPVSANTIFLSKAAVNLTITVPAILLDSIIIAIGLKTTLMEFLLLFMLPTTYALFIASLGLIVNLKFPNLNWTTEVMVIKQSAATMISVFAGMFIGAIPFILLILNTGLQPVYVDMILILLLITATWGMYKYLNSKGKKLFLSL